MYIRAIKGYIIYGLIHLRSWRKAEGKNRRPPPHIFILSPTHIWKWFDVRGHPFLRVFFSKHTMSDWQLCTYHHLQRDATLHFRGVWEKCSLLSIFLNFIYSPLTQDEFITLYGCITQGFPFLPYIFSNLTSCLRMTVHWNRESGKVWHTCTNILLDKQITGECNVQLIKYHFSFILIDTKMSIMQSIKWFKNHDIFEVNTRFNYSYSTCNTRGFLSFTTFYLCKKYFKVLLG